MWNETLFLEMGSTNLQHDSAFKHAKTDAHKAGFQIYLRAEGCNVSERGEQSLVELQQKTMQFVRQLCEKRKGDKKDDR